MIGAVSVRLAGSRGECQAYRMAEPWPAIRLRGIGRAFLALVGRIRTGSTRGQFTIHTDKVISWVAGVILTPATRG